MKKALLFVSVLMLILDSYTVYSQSSGNPGSRRSVRANLTGKVSDAKTGEPLPSASIYFPDLRTGSTTNAEGVYNLKNIPAGTYLMEVSYLGYASVLETINLQGDVTKEFALNPSFVEENAVTVTGVSAATSVRRTPIPVSIIRKEDFLRGASTNLVDALSKAPGVAQVSTGPAISKPFIRGLGYNRVVVVNDGIRQEGQQWGDEHGIEVDEYNVSKAEILKGPASLMYGSDALAGVVNFISMVPVAEGTTRGNFFTNYQTNNRQRGLHADIAGNSKGFIWGAYGSYKAAADYRNKYDGYVFNSKFNEKNFGGYIGANKHWGFTHLYLTSFDQHVGLVEGDRDSATGKFLKLVEENGAEETQIASGNDFTSTDPFVPNQRVKHFKLVSENSFNLGADRVTATIGFQRNQRQEFGNVLDPGEKELYFDLRTINYNFQYHFGERNNWRTTVGVNGMQQSSRNKGEETLIPEYDLFDVGLFLFEQKRFNQLTISGGIRYDNRSLNSKAFNDGGVDKFNAFTKNFSNVSGSAGLSYEASKHVTLKFNLARGFRAPSIPELASNGAHEGTNRYEYGEQDLKSERSFQVDGGLDINSEHVSLSASIFYNNVRNFIYYRKLVARNGQDSILNDGSDQLMAFRFDQHNAALYGAELNLDIHPHPLDWLHIENSFSYVRGKLSQTQDGSDNLPFIPAPRLLNEIKVDLLKKGNLFKNLYIVAELDNTFSQNHAFTGYNTETTTPGYSLFNAGLGTQVVRKGKPLFNVYITANNITDVAYQNHLSRLKYVAVNNVTGRQGVFNMGRNVSFKLNVPLNFSRAN
ncbi:TonB-dependent receptor [Segetibacter sp. 3557_3]|uniref:TonB-dependent receptor n=1 Tax=Segetibacter sp. 3557_3 TaxID=2547429 RepID=UPI001058BBAC|nr:TonB-dependent receptor [Segetibacter sp. 3557_3]TDH19803.1 TonB-dependent receptor [Segetibacter sp. 3557_3]